MTDLIAICVTIVVIAYIAIVCVLPLFIKDETDKEKAEAEYNQTGERLQELDRRLTDKEPDEDNDPTYWPKYGPDGGYQRDSINAWNNRGQRQI